MPYVLLAGAIVAEVLGTTAMKASDGFSKLWPSVWTAVAYLVSFALLAQTLKSMAVGTAYAIWSAVGTALVVAIGVVFFGESTSVVRMLGIALIIGGVVLQVALISLFHDSPQQIAWAQAGAALVVLAAGSWEPDAIARGYDLVGELQAAPYSKQRDKTFRIVMLK